ncbi:MAG: hypothetical protein ABFS12_03990 [Bacteroidota bacterium]
MAQSLSAQDSVQKDETKFKEDFLKEIEPIKLYDPLASTLGVIEENGEIYYHYYEVVKFAGHSCPAVSGAYMLTKIALKELYGEETPMRGNIKVKLKGEVELNVNGPISQVISFITGAAPETGFKGLGGKYSRYQLLSFDENALPDKGVTADVEFERLDNGKKVSIAYRPSLIPKDPTMGELMQKVLSGRANVEEKERFGNLWQKGVKIILTSAPQGTFVITNYD